MGGNDGNETSDAEGVGAIVDGTLVRISVGVEVGPDDGEKILLGDVVGAITITSDGLLDGRCETLLGNTDGKTLGNTDGVYAIVGFTEGVIVEAFVGLIVGDIVGKVT